jgi:hypothetical protein
MRRLHRNLIVTSFACAFLTLSLAGCAVLFSPTRQPVPVTSTPEGAQVFVDDVLAGATPITLELDARTSYEIVVRHLGQERRIMLETGVNGAMVALDLVPGLALAGLGVLALSDDQNPEEWNQLIGGSLIAAGVGSAALNLAIDGSTGRWRRLSPGEVVVVFD